MHPLIKMLYEHEQSMIGTPIRKKTWKNKMMPPAPLPNEMTPINTPVRKKRKFPLKKKEKKSKTQLKHERIQKNLDAIQKKADEFRKQLSFSIP